MCMEKRCYLPPGVYYFQDENGCTFDRFLRDWESPDDEKELSMSHFTATKENRENTTLSGTLEG